MSIDPQLDADVVAIGAAMRDVITEHQPSFFVDANPKSAVVVMRALSMTTAAYLVVLHLARTEAEVEGVMRIFSDQLRKDVDGLLRRAGA